MGTWGVEIFSDDLAADVRDDWQERLQSGQSPETLTQYLINEYAPAKDDSNEAVIFWLSLALLQFESGQLQPAIRDKALKIIKAGGDISRWAAEDKALAKQRKKELDALAAKLSGPQPKQIKPKQSAPIITPFNIGDVIKLHNKDTGATALVIVVAHADGHPKGTIDPVIEMLLWEELSLPSRKEILKLPNLVTNCNGECKTVRPHMFVIMNSAEEKVFTDGYGEVVATGVIRKPSGNFKNGATEGGEVVTSYSTWQTLTDFLGHKAINNDIALTKQTAENRKRWNIFKRR